VGCRDVYGSFPPNISMVTLTKFTMVDSIVEGQDVPTSVAPQANFFTPDKHWLCNLVCSYTTDARVSSELSSLSWEPSLLKKIQWVKEFDDLMHFNWSISSRVYSLNVGLILFVMAGSILWILIPLGRPKTKTFLVFWQVQGPNALKLKKRTRMWGYSKIDRHCNKSRSWFISSQAKVKKSNLSDASSAKLPLLFYCTHLYCFLPHVSLWSLIVRFLKKNYLFLEICFNSMKYKLELN